MNLLAVISVVISPGPMYIMRQGRSWEAPQSHQQQSNGAGFHLDHVAGAHGLSMHLAFPRHHGFPLRHSASRRDRRRPCRGRQTLRAKRFGSGTPGSTVRNIFDIAAARPMAHILARRYKCPSSGRMIRVRAEIGVRNPIIGSQDAGDNVEIIDMSSSLDKIPLSSFMRVICCVNGYLVQRASHVDRMFWLRRMYGPCRANK
ncbi:predicted protein [Uncinocarpus reesii 1704]|uniref:Uncharacterized protein n=1 Tax=Uncinocarpus reesii (strain UAMH 1704) TaxID=336963 RepID=C4JIM5_UNCRE|nr:uncharacterized protein UREG_02886 [Uncinocarpus reesii 1704]EEP78037.1 predicted protein [Uncinocarpus reesii 1704]